MNIQIKNRREKERLKRFFSSRKKIFLLIISVGLIFSGISNEPFNNRRVATVSAYNDEEIENLNNQIKSKEKEINQLKARQKEYESKILQKQEEIQSLESQIDLFEDQIKALQDKIKLTEMEIETTNLQINKLSEEIRTKEIEVKKQKETLSGILRTLYEFSQVSTMEMVIGNGKLSDFIDTITYVNDIQSSLKGQLETVKQLKTDLENEQKEFESKKAELDILRADLAGEKANLDAQKNAKESLLAQTRASESEYKKIRANAEAQEDKILKETIPVLKAKIQELSVPPSSGYFMNPLKNNTCITSYFWANRCFYSDGVCRRHYGDDLKAYQGQALYAAADGIVIKTQTSCSHRYIVIQHTDANLATIYMHLSRIAVTQGSTVKKGQLIGNTGGTIGTCGAGTSTGPHLHFEVRNLEQSCESSCRYWPELGKPVNPRDYVDYGGGSCY